MFDADSHMHKPTAKKHTFRKQTKAMYRCVKGPVKRNIRRKPRPNDLPMMLLILFSLSLVFTSLTIFHPWSKRKTGYIYLLILCKQHQQMWLSPRSPLKRDNMVIRWWLLLDAADWDMRLMWGCYDYTWNILEAWSDWLYFDLIDIYIYSIIDHDIAITCSYHPTS